jgi:hypothetical protein
VVYKLSNPYHTQRNNAFDPADTCQVTAAVMALRATGIEFSFPSDVQPEDHLAHILGGEEAREKVRREYPSMAKRPPREIHAVLSWAINERFVGRKVTVFSPRVTMEELLFRVAARASASLVSGRFTKSGHIVALVGFESDQGDLDAVAGPGAVRLDGVSRVIIDDPWGDFTAGYRDPDGNDVSLTLNEFNYLTREYEVNRKWAHLFDRDGIF